MERLACFGVLCGCSSGSSGAGEGQSAPDASRDATQEAGGGHDGGDQDATTQDAAEAGGVDAPAGDAHGGGAGDGAADAADAGDGAAPGEGGVGWTGDGGYVPPSALCAAKCTGGETVCQNGCGPIDWRLGCAGSSCHPSIGPGAPNLACAVPNAVPACAGGGCAVAQCDPGYADCDHDPSNGCEADLESPGTCGACGVSCAQGQLCSPSGCVAACAPPLTQCTDRCVDLTKDPAHCGSCTTACPAKGLALATCSSGSCGQTCVPGDTACGGCIDLQNDFWNCGTCGHACPAPTNGRGSCVAGNCQSTCQPGWSLVGTVCQAPATTPGWVTKGLSAPEDIAVDGTRVYWTDTTSGTVNSIPLGGGSPTTLATGQAKPLRIAVDDTQVYWSNNLGGAVMHAPKDGSGTAAVLASANQPAGVAVAGGYVYWANDGQDASGHATVQRVAVTGGTVSTVLTNHVSDELQSDGARVLVTASSSSGDSGYYLLDATGSRVILDGADPTEMWFAQDGASFYLTHGTNITGLVIFSKASLTSNDAISLAGNVTPQGVPRPLPKVLGTGDGCALYFADASGIEMLVRGTDWPALIVASTTVHRIATSAGVVYWTDTTGGIGRVAVP